MKRWLFGLGVFLTLAAQAQQRISFLIVDYTADSMDAPTPDSLGKMIAARFSSEAEKVRAVYSWMTSHIAYNTAIYKPWKAPFRYNPDPLDTAAVWPSGDEMTARKVMRKRTALCDGYARLFKVLCDYAGVEAAIIQGYGRTTGTGDNKFRTNHTWNAVKIDSTWHLLDVTWASGYLNFADDFVAQKNDAYYLASPEEFINEHFPEDLRWTLLPSPPAVAEFRRMPFRSKNFYKYGVDTYFPNNGIVEAAVGDTLVFSLQLKDLARAKTTGADPFVDTTTYSLWPKSSFVKPVKEKAATVFYAYPVQPGVEWIHLVYNNDVVLNYRLKRTEVTVKNEEASRPASQSTVPQK